MQRSRLADQPLGIYRPSSKLRTLLLFARIPLPVVTLNRELEWIAWNLQVIYARDILLFLNRDGSFQFVFLKLS